MDWSDVRKSEEDVKRQIGDVPDTRSKEQRGQIRTPLGLASPNYCANCGRQFGFVYVSTIHIFYLCDDCEEQHGILPLPVVDEDYMRGRKEV